MLNARRVCLGNTARPLLLLPVLIVMLATLVMGLQAANCALSTLRQSREAQHVYAMLATLVMGLQAANCALNTLRQSREAQHACATRGSAAMAPQLALPVSPGSTAM